MKKAFTLLELLVVFGLVGILFSMAIIYSQVSVVRQDLYSQVDLFASYTRLSQSAAAAGEDDTDHGIHLANTSYTLFQGSVYDANDVTNEVVDLPPTVVIQNISLNGGGSNLVFLRPHGETSTYGTFDFYSTSLDKTITLTLNSSGSLNY